MAAARNEKDMAHMYNIDVLDHFYIHTRIHVYQHVYTHIDIYVYTYVCLYKHLCGFILQFGALTTAICATGIQK